MALEDWDQRELCPDGGCVGVIGPDGTCKVCGRVAPNWGNERERGLNIEVEPEDAPPQEQSSETTPAATAAPSPETQAEPGEWIERKLCPDGGCVGVIGDDGHCKVCGRTAA